MFSVAGLDEVYIVEGSMTNLPGDELDEYIDEELGKLELDERDLDDLTVMMDTGDSLHGDQDNVNHQDAKSALEEFGFDTSDWARGNKAFDSAEVATLTGSTLSDAAVAVHVARDDMAESGDQEIPKYRHSN